MALEFQLTYGDNEKENNIEKTDQYIVCLDKKNMEISSLNEQDSIDYYDSDSEYGAASISLPQLPKLPEISLAPDVDISANAPSLIVPDDNVTEMSTNEVTIKLLGEDGIEVDFSTEEWT